MADSQHLFELTEDMLRLQAMLRKLVVPAAADSSLMAGGKDVSILNVACGACDEAEALSSFFTELRRGGRSAPGGGGPGKKKRRVPAGSTGPGGVRLTPQEVERLLGRKGGSLTDLPLLVEGGGLLEEAAAPPVDGAVHLVGIDVRERELDQARERFVSGGERSFEFLHGDASKLSSHRALRDQFDVVFFRHQNLYHGRTLWRKIFEQGLAKLNDDGLLVITSYFDREHELALEAFAELGAEVVASAANGQSRDLPAVPGKSVDRHVAVLRKKRGP